MGVKCGEDCVHQFLSSVRSPLCEVDVSAYLGYLRFAQHCLGGASEVFVERGESLGFLEDGSCGGVNPGGSTGGEFGSGGRVRTCGGEAPGVRGLGVGECESGGSSVPPAGGVVIGGGGAALGVCGLPVEGDGVRRVVAGEEVSGSGTRGLNFERNRASRLRRKAARAARASGAGAVGQGQSVQRYWREVGCDTVASLQETRARRLILENQRAADRAECDIKRIRAESTDELIARRVEVEKAVLDGQLSGKYSMVGSGRARGWVEAASLLSSKSTVPSNNLTSALPSLRSGSLSPNSSISVEESQRLVKRCDKLELEVFNLRAAREKDQEKIKDLVGYENGNSGFDWGGDAYC